MDHPTTDVDTEAQSYYDHIELMCDIIEDRVEEGDYDLPDLVWQEVDNSQYVIYNSKNLDALQISQSDPDEFNHLISDGDSWREVIQVMAYKVVEQDVWNELRDRDIPE